MVAQLPTRPPCSFPGWAFLLPGGPVRPGGQGSVEQRGTFPLALLRYAGEADGRHSQQLIAQGVAAPELQIQAALRSDVPGREEDGVWSPGTFQKRGEPCRPKSSRREHPAFRSEDQANPEAAVAEQSAPSPPADLPGPAPSPQLLWSRMYGRRNKAVPHPNCSGPRSLQHQALIPEQLGAPEWPHESRGGAPGNRLTSSGVGAALTRRCSLAGPRMAPVEYLVADASAFLRGAPLQEIGRRVYTTREVLAEIRDRAARRRLAGLPFELLLRQPFPEHVRLVSEFSKQTGDFRSLSAADIQVLALTLQLEAEHGGGRPLRTEPRPQVQLSLTHRHPEAPVDVPGFHVPPQTKCPGNEKIPLVAERYPGDPVALAETEFSSFLFWRNPLPNIEEDLESLLVGDPLPPFPHSWSGCMTGTRGISWLGGLDRYQVPEILPNCSILHRKQTLFCWRQRTLKARRAARRRAGSHRGTLSRCSRALAGGNVLLQMGLHVLAFNGLLIQHARSYILHCHGCFRTTSKMTRLFCPHCGNKTLKKVAVTVKDDGSFHLHFSQNPKVLNPRGLRHSLPAPQGGKHASNPHLTEDQRFPQQRLSRKARQKTNAFDPDYVAGVSPFAEHDIHSRAANLQIRDAVLGAGRRRLNPNMSRKKCLKNKCGENKFGFFQQPRMQLDGWRWASVVLPFSQDAQ
ncbi:hypothetical protein E2320_001357, partial [Naja naja]